MTHKIFITCGQGLEPLLQEELKELNYDSRPGYRGVYVDLENFSDIYRINYLSRIAGRVLLRLVSFKCRNQKDLYDGALQVDWLHYLPRGKTFAIDANVSHKELRNSLYAAQVIKDAICDQYRDKTGARPSVDTKNPDLQINLFVNRDEGILSFDTSGSPLHKRGYRLEAVEAPLQESLAASLLRLSGYTGDEIVYDPCCGSGTLLIEAAMLATRTPAGFYRKEWGFLNHPDFNQSEWDRIKREADEQRREIPQGKIFGTDVSRNAVRIARMNIKAAGLAPIIEIGFHDFREYTPPIAPNFMISNPPHGLRLGEEESLTPLYRALGDFMKQKMAKPSRGFIFTGSMVLAKQVGLAPKKRHVIENSGVESRFLEFDLY
jgi:putative N6-adenine-specific DNA methylase